MVTDRPTAPTPADPPQTPKNGAPDGAVDTHFHMIGDDPRFPFWEGRVEDPPPGRLSDWANAYQRMANTLGFSRGVVVHSILYGGDNSVTAAAVAALGPDRYRGIGLVPDDADESALDTLVEQGIAGIRLNTVHGGILSWQGVKHLAPALAERGLHVQMLTHASRQMRDLAPDVATLPVPVVFDHLAWPDLAAGTEEPGFKQLCRLLGDGQCWVKLSAVYRLAPPPWDAADAAVAALVAANPERCLWGTDWPHLMLADASMPDAGALLDAFDRAVPDPATRHRILVDNPAKLYGF